MYDALAPYYDELFPASDTSVEFLLRFCRPAGRVLDIACGVGAHSRKIAGRGFEVIGVDLDEHMISLARERLAPNDPEFHVGDMMDLETLLHGRPPFDLAFCIGNSIIHLPDFTSIERSIRSIAGVLVPGGSFAVQIINFDRLSDGRVPEFETLVSTDGAVSFHRRYEVFDEGNRVDFVTSLVIDGEKTPEDRTPLVVLERDRLISIFEQAGLTDCTCYGGFDGSEWSNQSFVTIVVAQKMT